MHDAIAILSQGLVKSYGRVQALHGVDLEVKQGEIFGFLGPNGAGKTTTIRCMLDLIRPQGGTLRVLGYDPQVDHMAIRVRSGYIPGELHLDENMTGQGALTYFDSLRGGIVDWGYVNRLAERLKVDLKRPIRNLSHGNKQKIGIIQGLMHQPELLLLDEPTLGLDPLMQQEVLRLLREARTNGATVFFSSHIINEVEALAERVAIIRQGIVVEVVEVAALQERALRRVHIRFSIPVDYQPILQLPEVEFLGKDDQTGLLLQVKGDMDQLIKTLAKFPVVDFETQRPSLEEVFLTYYKNDQEEL
jgi:ABC-2 type transport system ATP-binding protein